MKLVFCNSNMIGSWIIRKLTFSRWSHVAIVDGENVIEAVWPRVRRVPLAHLLETHRDHEFADIDVPLGHIELFPADIDIDFESIALSFAKSQVGKLYDLRALFGLITPTRDWERPEEWDCAELVAAAVNAGSRRTIFRSQARITPQMLYLLAE